MNLPKRVFLGNSIIFIGAFILIGLILLLSGSYFLTDLFTNQDSSVRPETNPGPAGTTYSLDMNGKRQIDMVADFQCKSGSGLEWQEVAMHMLYKDPTFGSYKPFLCAGYNLLKNSQTIASTGCSLAYSPSLTLSESTARKDATIAVNVLATTTLSNSDKNEVLQCLSNH